MSYSMVAIKNCGAFLDAQYGLIPNVVTAGTAGSGTAQTGTAIDTTALGAKFGSCKVAIPVGATMAATKTLTVAAKVEHSTDNSTWADYTTAVTFTHGSTASTGTQTIATSDNLDVDLSSARRYVRVNVTPTLSATVTDTAAIAASVVFGGAAVLPAP